MKKLFIVFIGIIIVFSTSCAPSVEASPTIDILSVGKADCSVIRYQGFVVVIDTAEEENTEEIISFLQGMRIEKIDYLIHSHFDKDHIGGSEEILKRFSVKNVIESDFASQRPEYDRYHKIIEEKKIALKKISEPISFPMSDLTILIHPPKKSSYEHKEDNNASLMVSILWNELSYLFCGDAMEERIEEFISENQREYQFVKIPYHGNYLKNYEAFLENTKPKFGVICCSEKNPADEKTLNILQDNGIEIYQTKFGNVRILVKSNKLHLSYY